MATHHRPMYKVCFYGGKRGAQFLPGGSCHPDPLWLRHWWRHAERSQWVCLRSKVSSGACVTSNCIFHFISQISCIHVVSSEGHTCPRNDLWPRTYSSLKNDVKLSHNFKAVLASLTWCNCKLLIDSQNILSKFPGFIFKSKETC